MKQFFALFLIAVTIEAITTYIRTWFVDNHFQWQQALTCVLGIALAFAYNLDYLRLFEVEALVPYVGSVLTGIVISRGSNYLFDFLKKVTDIENGKIEYDTEVPAEDIKG